MLERAIGEFAFGWETIAGVGAGAGFTELVGLFNEEVGTTSTARLAALSGMRVGTTFTEGLASVLRVGIGTTFTEGLTSVLGVRTGTTFTEELASVLAVGIGTTFTEDVEAVIEVLAETALAIGFNAGIGTSVLLCGTLRSAIAWTGTCAGSVSIDAAGKSWLDGRLRKFAATGRTTIGFVTATRADGAVGADWTVFPWATPV